MFGFGIKKEAQTADPTRHPGIRILKLSAISMAGTETHVYQVQVRMRMATGCYWRAYRPSQIDLRAAELIRDVWIKNLAPEVVG